MPELPEVQLVVDSLNDEVSGRTITGVEIHWPEYVTGMSVKRVPKTLVGQTFHVADRRGKFILIRLDDYFLLLHLRMTGKLLRSTDPDSFPKHTHAVFALDDGGYLAFNDARKFGRLELVPIADEERRVARLNLGVEPLSEDFTAEALAPKLEGRMRSIKNILMDQTVIAGLGNIYALEILFAAGIDPFREGGSISDEEIDLIVRHTPTVLKRALELGGSSIRDYIRVNGESGRMQNEFNVYGREGQECPRCGGVVQRGPDAGRSSFWCPSCQK